MSSCDRRAALAALGLALLAPGCFRPMLAEGGAGAELRGRIALPRGDGRSHYYLRRRLESRLGTPRDPDLTLEVRMRMQERGLAIAPDDAITRVTLTAIADWRLLRRGVPEPVFAETALSESGYNATGSLYAAEVTRRDIERRLAEDVAEQISRSILARADAVPGPGAS